MTIENVFLYICNLYDIRSIIQNLGHILQKLYFAIIGLKFYKSQIRHQQLQKSIKVHIVFLFSFLLPSF